MGEVEAGGYWVIQYDWLGAWKSAAFVLRSSLLSWITLGRESNTISDTGGNVEIQVFSALDI
jgi:hypothetical protein